MTLGSQEFGTVQAPDRPADFGAVFNDEVEEILNRRSKANFGRLDKEEAKKNLIGIALSGGGIRSATFCLGLLQAFESRKLLGLFDYMSTVSGGGFVGGWWSAWLTRKGNSKKGESIFPAQEMIVLERSPQEESQSTLEGNDLTAGNRPPETTTAGHDPTHHLRLYANYLTPRKGIMSGDTWRFITVILRNISITWSVLLPALVALILAGQLYFVIQHDPEGTFIDPNPGNTLAPEVHQSYRALGVLKALQEHEKNELDKIEVDAISPVLGMNLREYLAHKSYRSEEVKKRLKGVQADWLRGINDKEMQESARSELLAAQITAVDRKRAEIHERAREKAMEARLSYMAYGLVPLGVWTLLLGVLYLLLTMEPPRLLTKSVVWFVFLTAPVSLGLFARSLPADVANRWVILAEAAVISILLLISFRSELGLAKRVEVGRHRWLEFLRNKVSLAQTRVVVVLIVTGTVLLVSGFGHELFNENSYRFTEDAVAFWGMFTAAVAAVAGSLLIVSRMRPRAGVERQEWTARSKKTRLLIAVTPVLVVLLLAVGISWVGHALLEQWRELIKPQRGGTSQECPRCPYLITTCVGYLGIFISFVYALHESKLLVARKRESWWLYLRRVYTILLWLLTPLLLTLLFLSLHALELLRVVESTERPSNIWLLAATSAALVFGVSLLSLHIIKKLDRRRGGDLLPLILGGRETLLSAFAIIALLIYVILSFAPDMDRQPAFMYGAALWGMIVTAVTFIITIGWMADPNAFSMHGFYKDRLVRAYMGASNYSRGKGKEITEPDPKDDVLLKKLRNCKKGAPYHIINTTLNLTAAADLATAQRSSELFTLTQKYCGSIRTGYRPTKKYMKGRLTLGTAVAVSGAAASPNMGGLMQSAALAMVMTLFNIRLGFWVPTTNGDSWKESRARLWPFYLLREFLSQTNDLAEYCYLTDGGHFDNTGLYSLVQRGCRHIVVADCTGDPSQSFADLGNVIRRCRIDFRAEISLNIVSMKRGHRENRDSATSYYVSGLIRYDRRHLESLRTSSVADEELWGNILYIKPTIPAPEELADVVQYQFENDEFPHQSTLNQWFGEAQFESYRRLGYAYGQNLLKKVKDRTLHSASGVNELIDELFKSPK